MLQALHAAVLTAAAAMATLVSAGSMISPPTHPQSQLGKTQAAAGAGDTQLCSRATTALESRVISIKALSASSVADSMTGAPVGSPLGSYRLAQSADFRVKRAEMKRKAEQRRRQMKLDFERRSQEIKRERARTNNVKGPSTRSTYGSKPNTPAFDPARAPEPAVCLARFVQTARTAYSMHQLIGFLPLAKQETLKQRQASYDPSRAASKRLWFKKNNPRLTDRELTHLTQSPYAGALKRYKAIANKMTKIRSVKVKGNKATLSVSTKSDTIVNGVKYSYGTATVVMVGEGGSWRFSKYNDSDIVYKNPPP